MKRKNYIISLLTVLTLTLSGCAAGIDSGKNSEAQIDSHTAGTNGSDETDSSTGGLSESNADIAKTDAEMFTDRDYRTEYEKQVVEISLNKDSVSCDSDAVSISGSMVIIREEGTYVISGTLEDGMVVVDAEDTSKLQIVLNQAEITSSDSAALYVLEADKVFVTLADGTENVLANGGSFVAIDENNIDGAVYSKQDLTFNGAGSLSVTSPAGHGIVCKDDLIFTGGTYTICSASHALDANDSVRVTNASITADAGKDGIHAENSDDPELGFIYISSGSFIIEAEGDGISAASYLQIADGTFDITTGGGSENGTKSNSGNYGDFMGGGFMKGDGMGGGRPNRRSMDDGQTDEPGALNGNRMPEGAAAPDGSNMPEGAAPDGSSMPEGAAPDGSSMPEEMPAPTGNEFPAGTRAFDNNEPSGDTGSSDESASMKGIKIGGNLQISGGSFTINSADDAVHSNASVNIISGTFHLASGDDGIHADETLTVSGGTIDVTESYEGLEALHVIISDGDISVVATDDGLNAAGGTDSSGMGGRDNGMFGGRGMGGMSSGNGSIVISGGTLYINASGDGIDANGSLEITGGNITVCGPTQGDTATLDYDTTGVISGGTFIGTGASGMAQTFSDSEQGVISVNVGNQSADTTITLKDADGNVLLTHTPELPFAIVILSSPDLVKGETYSLTVGTATSEFEAS